MGWELGREWEKLVDQLLLLKKKTPFLDTVAVVIAVYEDDEVTGKFKRTRKIFLSLCKHPMKPYRCNCSPAGGWEPLTSFPDSGNKNVIKCRLHQQL